MDIIETNLSKQESKIDELQGQIAAMEKRNEIS
jgi:uncharacterized coiled-coil protein SlyX